MNWDDIAFECIVEVAKRKEMFTGDDVMDLLQERAALSKEHRALGPVMVRAAKRGIMEKTETFQSSRRKTQHGSPRRVWLSLVYDPQKTASV